MNGGGFMTKWALFIYGYELNADAVQALTGFEGRKIAMMIPRPAAISDYSTVDGLQVYISMVSNKPFDRSVPPSPV